MQLSDKIKKFSVEQAIDYLNKNPVKNLPKLLDWADTFCAGKFEGQRRAIRKACLDPTDAHYPMVQHILNDIDPAVLKTTLVNFFIYGNIIGCERQDQLRAQYQCNIPWAILMDPTSACNLHCTGCWAAEYGNKLNLSLDELDDIIRQGKDMGVYFYIYTGGKPLVRKKDIITLCERHPDCEFLSFTNGTLIDEAFADEMLRVKNFIPAISLEGDETTTDSRRGAGTYQKVLRAIDLLHERKLIYGISSCYTSVNWDAISSEAYFRQLIDLGCLFIWYFHYMPVGNDASPELLPSPEQRRAVLERIRHNRSTMPLSRWTSRTTRSTSVAASRAAGATCTSRQRRHGSVRVHPLFRFEHPRKDPARGHALAAVSGLPRRAAVQRQYAPPVPDARKSGEAAQDRGGFRRALDRPHEPRDGRAPVQQVRRLRRLLDSPWQSSSGAAAGRGALPRPSRQPPRRRKVKTADRKSTVSRSGDGALCLSKPMRAWEGAAQQGRPGGRNSGIARPARPNAKKPSPRGEGLKSTPRAPLWGRGFGYRPLSSCTRRRR